MQRQNLKYGGNEAMTKQRIGVLAVCLLLAAAGMGQTPAKQMTGPVSTVGFSQTLALISKPER
jgi:hypothetical protein